MKKTLLTLAVFGAFSGAANAQSSVTVFGNIDAGFMYSKTPSGSTLGFQEGQYAPSVFGLKGSEDIGGGLKAGFELEGGYDSGNGAQDVNDAPISAAKGAPGALFGRQAFVKVGGDWGAIQAGLQYDPALVASIATEPRGMADSFSMLAPAVGVTLLGTNIPMGAGGAFDANSISYTYAGNGLYVSVLHEFGGQANNAAAQSGNSIGASYANAGFTVSAGYAGYNDAVGNTSSQYTNFGLGYAAGQFAVRAQYGEYKTFYSIVAVGTPASDVKGGGIGADWKISVADKLNLAYYSLKDNGALAGGAKTTVLALADYYSLSKHTTLFAQIAAIDASAGPVAPTNLSNLIGEIYAVSGTGAIGHTTAIGFGINHAF